MSLGNIHKWQSFQYWTFVPLNRVEYLGLHIPMVASKCKREKMALKTSPAGALLSHSTIAVYGRHLFVCKSSINAVSFLQSFQEWIHLFSASLRARRRSKSIFKRLVLLSYESDAAKIYRRRKSLSGERLHLHKMSLSATITHVRRARITFFCKRGCKTSVRDNRFELIFPCGIPESIRSAITWWHFPRAFVEPGAISTIISNGTE